MIQQQQKSGIRKKRDAVGGWGAGTELRLEFQCTNGKRLYKEEIL